MKRRDKTPLLIRLMQWVFPKLERWVPTLAERMFRLVFYVPIGYPVPEKEREAEARAKRISLTAAGKRVQGYSWGSEGHPYVLFMHGWAGRTTQFRKFLDPLIREGFRAVGFDGPAHGKSEGIQTTILEFEEM